MHTTANGNYTRRKSAVRSGIRLAAIKPPPHRCLAEVHFAPINLLCVQIFYFETNFLMGILYFTL